MQCTPRNSLQKLDPLDVAFVASMANNMDIIDAAIAKCNFAGTREPGPGDDSDDGYSVGSNWFYSGKIFTCFDDTAGAAVWLQTYGSGGDIDASTLDGHDSSYFAVATKGVTNGDLHDHSGGDGVQIDHGSLAGLNGDDHPQYLLEQNNKYRSYQAILDGGGQAIEAGFEAEIVIDVPCTIVRARAEAIPVEGQSAGSIAVDIWKKMRGTGKPTDSNSITAFAPVAISSDVTSEDVTLTGWTKSLVDGDILRLHVDSCTNFQKCTISLKVEVS